jgi:hypothetical protein
MGFIEVSYHSHTTRTVSDRAVGRRRGEGFPNITPLSRDTTLRFNASQQCLCCHWPESLINVHFDANKAIVF